MHITLIYLLFQTFRFEMRYLLKVQISLSYLYSLAPTKFIPFVINFFFFQYFSAIFLNASSASEGVLSLHFYGKTKKLEPYIQAQTGGENWVTRD